jgi:hypothetical protein
MSSKLLFPKPGKKHLGPKKKKPMWFHCKKCAFPPKVNFI